MLSPTQFKPITTVSARLPICDFAFPRSLPAIMHPEPELRVSVDTARNHIVDSRRQSYGVPFCLSQFIDTNRFQKLETMPRFLRNAKNEHNRRIVPDGQFGRCRRGPCRSAKKRDKDTLAWEDGLIGQDHHGRLLQQSFE